MTEQDWTPFATVGGHHAAPSLAPRRAHRACTSRITRARVSSRCCPLRYNPPISRTEAGSRRRAPRPTSFPIPSRRDPVAGHRHGAARRHLRPLLQTLRRLRGHRARRSPGLGGQGAAHRRRARAARLNGSWPARPCWPRDPRNCRSSHRSTRRGPPIQRGHTCMSKSSIRASRTSPRREAAADR